jgi:hypothetical protein
MTETKNDMGELLDRVLIDHGIISRIIGNDGDGRILLCRLSGAGHDKEAGK